jgi:hypothetical protein
MSGRRITVGHRLRYGFDRIMSRGSIAMIGALAILSLLLVATLRFGVASCNPTPLARGDTPGTAILRRRLFSVYAQACRDS